jgi:hypothetical protein
MAITLENLYKNLGPSSISNPSNTVSKNIFEIIADCLYDPTGKAKKFVTIKNDIAAHFNNGSAGLDTAAEKALLAQHFHGIGEDGPIEIYDGKDNYWTDVVDANIMSIIGSDLTKAHRADLPKISVFPIRGPLITPAKRGAEKISFFLNYTPSIVTAQMVPFLDVKFITARTKKDSVSSPGIIRFLMGSGPIERLSAADKLIVLGDYTETASTGSSGYGMEMFLMPQTLTNMDALGPSSTGMTRLTNMKPFLPFASIEGFDVSIQNAGAGAFAHKKGTLKLKIHDKSRISEISEFIKGSDGFSRVSITTAYGWSAPKNRGTEDEYSSFINDNMQTIDKWTVSNSQFSFDAGGQVAVNLELVSKSAAALQGASMVGAESGVEKFYNALKLIDSVKGRITGRKNYQTNTLTEKIFNAAAGDGHLKGMGDDQKKQARIRLKSQASKLGSDELDVEEAAAFMTAVDIVTAKDDAAAGVDKTITNLVNAKFATMNSGPDPFLPNGAFERFASELVKHQKIKATHATKKKQSQPAAKNAAAKKQKDNELTAVGLVSFGKVFLTLIAPQINKSMCDELQIFFYGLNDECGWSSGFSTAEFPIDMSVLSKVYREKIKTAGTTNFQIETMLNVIIDSHFTEPSALGYGMSDFYDYDKKEKEKLVEKTDSSTVNSMAAFVRDFGDLRLPAIEMFTETVSHVVDGAETVIKRIHIYDKLNSPYGFEQQILDSKEGLIVANIDKAAVRKKANEALKAYGDLKTRSAENLADIKQKFMSEKKTATASSAAETMSLTKSVTGSDFIDAKERGAIKSYLTTKLPTLIPGTNGSLILSVSAASKTDSTQGAINLINSMQSKNAKDTGADDGLSDPKNMPLRSVPMQVTMSTLGVPTASLYQKYFIDFNTGTTIDNIYNCSQIQHSISQGKFTTNWTFIYDNGYARFISPASATTLIISGELEAVSDAEAAQAKIEEKKGKGKGK